MKTLRRILWHVNRTPGAKVIKFARRLTQRSEVTERRKLARALPVSPEAVAVANRLRSQGYSEANGLIRLESRDELARAVMAAAEMDGVNQGNSFTTRKDFWVSILDRQMKDGSLPADSPFARFAMQSGLVEALAQIYGEIPRLSYVSVTLSQSTNAALQVSQLWHRDYDDTKVIKLFVYLTDVSDEDGPFTFLPGPVSDQVGFTLRSHQSDASLAKRIDLVDAMSVTGPRLNCFLVETSRCLHMGSRVNPGRTRLMFTATYVSSPIIYPERPIPFFKVTGSESTLERYLLASG